MPAIGAMAKGEGSSTDPILIRSSKAEPAELAEKPNHSTCSACSAVLIRFHISCVDFDRDRLTDQIDGQDEPRALGVLAHQPSDDPPQRPICDFDHHPFVNHRTGIELQIAS